MFVRNACIQPLTVNSAHNPLVAPPSSVTKCALGRALGRAALLLTEDGGGVTWSR